MSAPAAEKHCRTCGEAKPLDGFYNNGRGGLKPDCKPCYYASTTAWAAANPDAVRRYRRRGNLRLRYGIDETQYEALLAHQGGGCAICGAPPVLDGKCLPVDHDAGTGAVRGVLCTHCNLGIGHLRHDPNLLAAAVAYLADPPAARITHTTQKGA